MAVFPHHAVSPVAAADGFGGEGLKMVGWKDMVSMLGVGSVIEALFGCLWLRARVFFLGQKTNHKDSRGPRQEQSIGIYSRYRCQ